MKHYSTRNIEQDVAAALRSGAKPVNGEPYPEELRIINSFKSEARNKPYFEAEKRNAKIIGCIGAVICALAPWLMGWTNLSLALFIIGFVAACIGFHHAFFRAYPLAVNAKTIEDSKNQLEEVGESGQNAPNILHDTIFFVLALADGFLTASAATERLGHSILTPRMAILVGALVGIVLTASLFVMIKSAAREARKTEARRAICELEDSNPSQASAMKKRLGAVLGHRYSPRDNSIKVRVGLVVLVIVMAAASFGLRLGAFAEASANTNQEQVR
jgi:hypothetical protein